MKLASFTVPGETTPRSGVVQDDRIVAFGGSDGVIQVLAGAAAPNAAGETWGLNEVTLAAPLMPRTVYAIGRNYDEHIAETQVEAPDKPMVFVKVTGSVAPPGGPVRRPAIVELLDYEGELAIVIGRDGAIGGFCVADDVSARELQRSERHWVRAKGADTFTPFGPWVTTADEVPDPGNLRLRTWVNDELRQDSNTSKLIFGCQEIVDFIAQTCTLHPGDLILTGTPHGVGSAMSPPRFLAPGDRVRIEVESLGAIEHPIV